MRAGMKRFISQIPNTTVNIPIVLILLPYENNVLAIVPLIPNSAMAKVGMMASIQNITVVNQKPDQKLLSTCNNCSIKMYCKTKTMYLKKDKESNLNKIFASNVSNTLMYFENLPA